MPFDLIVNTRPAHKQAELNALLSDYQVLSLPALALAPTDFTLPEDWQSNDIIFFVSQYAVDCFFNHLQQQGLAWPSHCYAGAVGQVTADALAQYGIADERILVAIQGYADSEAFLEWLEASYGIPKRVLIVRAQHGRDWLSQQLQQRDVTTRFLTVYQRVAAEWMADEVQDLIERLRQQPSTRICWLLTSRESVDAIVAQWQRFAELNEHCWSHDFLVFHPRIGEHLHVLQQQFAPEQLPLRIHLTAPDNQSIISTLKNLS